jgi:hypothetical protein
LRSIQQKASVFSFSGPYLNNVAAPLCMQFLDAVHDSATELKNALFHQQRRKLPTALLLQSNVKEWIQLINGTHMSAQLLIQDGDEDDDDDNNNNGQGPTTNVGARSTAHQDMQRFGRSLERLEQVFVEEFASSFVEIILLEKTKLASYLMQCSHVLSSSDEDENDNVMTQNSLADLSPELADAQYILELFLEVVDECPLLASMAAVPFEDQNAALYASRALRDRVLTLVSEQFLDVALDWHGTTPEIIFGGAQAFCADVTRMLGDSLLPATAMRLLDVVKCMAMDSTQLSAMGDALCGLAGHSSPPLSEDLFLVDDRVLEEAMSMIRAKNFVWIHLGDFLSILNRRKDLCNMAAFTAF